MTRYEALQCILWRLPEQDLALFTTGMISREAFNIRDRPGNFYMIGSMGLLTSLGLGLALQAPARTIWVVEGDGSALMSLGTLPLIATCRPANLIHIVLDNEAYESTGGQPTISAAVDLAALAQAAGYALVRRVEEAPALDAALEEALSSQALRFILAKVTGRAAESLGRVSLTPEALKQRFAQAFRGVANASRNAAAGSARPC
jgi:thiamine pyrophosphate-dependent acetolactate synthase large subunit-like protein